jgi:hypothetical protein
VNDKLIEREVRIFRERFDILQTNTQSQTQEQHDDTIHAGSNFFAKERQKSIITSR